VPPLPTASTSGTIRTEHSVQSLNSTEVISSEKIALIFSSRQDTYSTNELKGSANTLSPRSVLKMRGFSQRAKAIILASPLNALLICIPISWSLRLAVPNCHLINFVFSSLAIIYLKNLLSIVTHELSLGFGESVACLLEATTGNTFEFIVGILTIAHFKLQIVQSLLVGSILGNLLLVLGSGHYAGAIAHQNLRVSSAARRDAESLVPSIVIFVIGSATLFGNVRKGEKGYANGTEGSDFLNLSSVLAVLLLVLYFASILRSFQLRSCAKYEEDNIGSAVASTSHPATEGTLKITVHHRNSDPGQKSSDFDADGDGMEVAEVSYGIKNDEENISLSMAMGLALLAVVALVVTAESLVENIRAVTDEPLSLEKERLGLILLSAASKVPELLKVAAANDKRTRCCEVVIGSSLQIAAFIIPLTVIIGRIIGNPSLILFDPLESVTLFLVAFLVNLSFDNPGRKQGLLFIGSYAAIALFYWFYPRIISAVQAAFAR